MLGFDKVESTLFIPMIGRIYASERFPDVLFDKQALLLKGALPAEVLEQDRQSQYTLIASASRSANMDNYIRGFLKRYPQGAVVQLGCGLETTFYRNDDGHTQWYEVDLPDVIEYRRQLLPEQKREVYLAEDAFSCGWIRRVRADMPEAPLLVTAGGLFYYFSEEKVLGLLRMLAHFGPVEIVFDAVNRSGMAMLRKKYMKQTGHGDAEMFFYVDSAREFAVKSGRDIVVLSETPYYRQIPRKGLSLFTRISMGVSDRFGMVKMVHLQL